MQVTEEYALGLDILDRVTSVEGGRHAVVGKHVRLELAEDVTSRQNTEETS